MRLRRSATTESPKSPSKPQSARQKKRLKRETSPPRNLSEASPHTLLGDGLKALHSSNTDIVSGRTQELEKIGTFLRECLADKTSGALYLCGAPGTGKTLCVEQSLKSIEREAKSVKIVRLNAVGHSDNTEIFQALGRGLGIAETEIRRMPELAQSGGTTKVTEVIYGYQSRKRNPTIVLVDEVDQLNSLHFRRPGSNANSRRTPTRPRRAKADKTMQDSLTALFELALKKKSHIILIAIANAARLAECALSQIATAGKFDSIIFEPYSHDQLREIINTRLAQVSDCQILDKTALELCIRKVAAFDGDCRRTLDACRRAISSLILETPTTSSSPPSEALSKLRISSPGSSPIPSPILSPKSSITTSVTLGDMQKILQSRFTDDKVKYKQVLTSLPHQSKLILCAICQLAKEGSDTISFQSLLSQYRQLCKQFNIPVQSGTTTLQEGLIGIESTGLITFEKKRSTIRQKSRTSQTTNIHLQMPSDDVSTLLQELHTMFHTILDN